MMVPAVPVVVVRTMSTARMATVVPAVGGVTAASHGKRRARYDREREKT